MRAAILSAVLCAACVEPGAVPCGDGRTCPAGTTCDDVRALCLTDEQATVCKAQGIDNGDVCVADGNKGICDRMLCEPGCGDGTTDPNEQCDDGNFASHDGCSSRCEVEVPTWIPVIPAWRGISGHMAAYHAGIGSGRTILIGGANGSGLSDRIWQHDPTKLTEPERGWRDITDAFLVSERPPVRQNGAMAYDPNRNVIVLFGGARSNSGNLADFVTDTWEYTVSTNQLDGEPVGRWVKSTSPTSPSPRLYPAMAFDANLGKIVMLGGIDPLVMNLSDEMWTYDGTWSQLTPAGTFPSRARAGLAFDDVRDRLVYFGGGALDDTVFEFDGNTWTSASSSPSPGPRRNLSFAFDPDRGTTVLFGGWLGGTFDAAADTWEWNGSTWQLVSIPHAPAGRRSGTLVAEPGGLLLVGGQLLEGDVFGDAWVLASEWDEHTPRFGPGIGAASQAAYAPNARGIIVTGGQDNFALPRSDTWLFDGIAWRRRADLPDIRHGNNTIYDSARNRLLTFWGTDNDQRIASMWALAGDASGSWTQVPVPANAPDARLDASAVYDPSGQRVVVVGGAIGDISINELIYTTGTWFYDGAAWTSYAGEGPSAGGRPALTFDPERGVVVAFDSAGDTWQLAGTTWEKVIPASSSTPPGRELSCFAYDPFRRRFVLASGMIPMGGGTYSDVWELDPETWTWSPLLVTGIGPLPRFDLHAFAYHENARAIVLHGGRGGLLSQGDTWLLRYQSTTVDEDCDDSKDTDGDAQSDTEDPDCTPPPPAP